MPKLLANFSHGPGPMPAVSIPDMPSFCRSSRSGYSPARSADSAMGSNSVCTKARQACAVRDIQCCDAPRRMERMTMLRL